MIVPARKIGPAVVAVLVAPVIGLLAVLSPSNAQADVIVRPQPSPMATFAAPPAPMHPSRVLPMPEAATGSGIPMPQFTLRWPWLAELFPSGSPSATSSSGVGGQFTPSCTACAPRQFR